MIKGLLERREDTTRMRMFIGGISLTLTLATLLVMLWSVVPAPLYRLFMVSVGASEWSMWIGAVAFIGVGFAGWVIALGNVRLGSVSLICGLVAIALAAKPPLQALRVAAQEGVSLSLTRYLFGSQTPLHTLDVRQNVVYAEVDGRALHLDVYRPQQAVQADTARLPAVVVIHGGSWSGGSEGEFPAMSRTLAQNGAVVFDVEYRLASVGTQFPAQVADVKCAIGWIKDNAQTYGVDPQRIALLGRSAGGQLALLAAYAPDDPLLQPSCTARDTTVKAVISFYAPVDLAWGYDHPLRPDIINSQAMLQNYLGGTPRTHADMYRLASPTAHVASSSPPTLIIHGGFDRIVRVQHAHFMTEALQRAQVPHRLMILPWANHAFDFASNSWGAQISESLIREFLQVHL
jgi:acetyl esterase/lipase